MMLLVTVALAGALAQAPQPSPGQIPQPSPTSATAQLLGRIGYALSGGAIGEGFSGFMVTAGERQIMPDLTLARAGVIAGRVLDPSGQALAGVHVMALRPSLDMNLVFGQGAASGGGSRRAARFVPAGAPAQTNDLGEFRLYGLSPGTYDVEATLMGEVCPLWSGGVAGDSVGSSSGRVMAATFYGDTMDLTAEQAVSVSSGQTLGEVVIRMALVPVFEISGAVVDEAGAPVAGIDVYLMPAARAGSPPGDGNRHGQRGSQ